MNTLLKALRRNPFDTAVISAGIVTGVVLGILTIWGYPTTDLAIGATLEVLAILGATLFFIREKTDQVEQNTQETTKALQKLDRHLEEIRFGPHRLSEVFDTFGEKIFELEGDLKNADRVWILARTCRRLWTDFSDELMPLAQKGKLRLLLLDPEGYALGLTAKSAIWDRPDDGYRLKRDVMRFLEGLEDYCQKDGLDKFVRKIDYLPAWTLILVNPGNENGVIDSGRVYVEMATYRAHPRKRPAFTISSDNDYDLFSDFRDEYNKMWNEAAEAW